MKKVHSRQGKPKVKAAQEGGCSQLRLGFWIQIRSKECWVLGKCMRHQGYCQIACERVFVSESPGRRLGLCKLDSFEF